MSRAAVTQAIKNSSALQALGYASDQVYGASGLENSQANKIIVLRWGQMTPFIDVLGNEIVTVWVYDDPGSYVDINNALKIIRDDILLPMVQVSGDDDMTVTQVSFNGFSEDLYDDVMKRITRNAIFTVNSRNS